MAGKKKCKKAGTTSSESGDSDRNRLKDPEAGERKSKKYKRKRRANGLNSPTGSGSLPMHELSDTYQNAPDYRSEDASDNEASCYVPDSYQRASDSYRSPNGRHVTGHSVGGEQTSSEGGGVISGDSSYSNCLAEMTSPPTMTPDGKRHVTVKELLEQRQMRCRTSGGKGRELMARANKHHLVIDPDDDDSSFFAKIRL